MQVWVVTLSTSVTNEYTYESWHKNLPMALVELDKHMEIAEAWDVCASALTFQMRVPFWVMDRDKYVRSHWRQDRSSQGLLAQNCTGACEREEAWPRL